MISIGTYSDINNSYNQIWFIMRSLKSIPKVEGTTTLHIPDLSPSPELFKKYLYWREYGDWNKDTFERLYTPQFLAEMHEQIPTEFLDKLYVEGKYSNILLVCACKDDETCHRKLVLSILAGRAFEEQDNTIQFKGLPANYLDYWNTYKKFNNPFMLKYQKSVWKTKSQFYLLVAGSRTYSNYDELCQVLDYSLQRKIKEGNSIVVVSGGAKGTDTMAHNYALSRGFISKVMEADWERYGKSAGYRRNESMHAYISIPSDSQRGCICFWEGESKGTQHNFKLAFEYETPIVVYDFINHRFMRQEEIKDLC